MSVKLKFRRHTQRLAVCRLGAESPAPAWAPLAEAKVPIYAISTFHADWILIPAEKLENAVRALIAAGHNEI